MRKIWHFIKSHPLPGFDQKRIVWKRTLTIASWDSPERENADLVCYGVWDEKVLQEAIDKLAGGEGRWVKFEEKRWRWPWQPKVIEERAEGGILLLSGTMYLEGAVRLANNVNLIGFDNDKREEIGR